MIIASIQFLEEKKEKECGVPRRSRRETMHLIPDFFPLFFLFLLSLSLSLSISTPVPSLSLC